jgi:type I restriction enzyme S subunit
MNSPIGLRQVRDVQYGTAQKQFNISDAVGFLFPYPRRAEQEAIAEALSDADALIESLERLLAKKHQIKQGAMQELLTGKRRLPGFGGNQRLKKTEIGSVPQDWDVKPVSSVAFVTSGKRLPAGHSLTDQETPHPYIRVTDMRQGKIVLDDIKYVPVDAFPFITRYRIFTTDIFISVAGTLGVVGKIPRELDGANLTENADRITDIACSQDFLLHVLQSPIVQTAIEQLQTVGAQPKLALERIRKFLIPLPPSRVEQDLIAECLSDMDADLTALESKVAKARQVKQGMMQELLSGRIRLI